MEFKLNPYIQSTYQLNAIAKMPNGTRQYVKYPIDPNMIYDTNDFIDKTPNIDELVTSTVTYLPYSYATLEEVKKSGGSYEIQKCNSCGGKIAQIKLLVFEVVGGNGEE